MGDFQSLISRLEKTEGPDRELDAQIELALDFPDYRVPKELLNLKSGGYQEALERLTHDGFGSGRSPHRYTAALDAAVELVPEGWTIACIGQDDNKKWWCELRRGYQTSYNLVFISQHHETAACAVSEVALKARASEES